MPDPSTRARDKDRDAAIEVVEGAFVDGQLSAVDRDLRVERLLRAQTLGEIDGYLRDLQGRPKPRRPAAPAASGRGSSPRRPPSPPPRPRTPVLLWVVAAVGAAVIALFVVLTSVGSTDTSVRTGVVTQVPVPTPTLTPSTRPDVRLLNRTELTRLVNACRARFGTTRVVSATVYENYAVVQVPDEARGGRVRSRSWVWRAHEWSTGGPPQVGDQRPVDLSTLRPATVVRVLARTRSLLPHPNERYLIIGRDRFERAQPLLSAYVVDDFGSGYLATTFDGRLVRRVAPPRS